ncbi:MAG: hypothetical protein KJN92_16345 [Gemmatimonadetes bacterium]|nr:hypothetical protein [Gemmatimonadota bacterium]
MLEAFIDAPLRHEKLTVFPVIAPHGPVLPYLLSTEIQDSGVLTIREKGDSDPPALLVRNNSLHPLLILAGEPLPGENPGRLVQRSILLGGKTVTQVPASPVERGGWIASDRESEVTEWMGGFTIRKNQVGFLAFHGCKMLGLEALGSANLYGPLHRRLLIRFVKQALDASPEEDGDSSALERKAGEILDGIGNAERLPGKRIGVGEYCTLAGPVSGGDLTHQGHLVHLSVESSSVTGGSEQWWEGEVQCS